MAKIRKPRSAQKNDAVDKKFSVKRVPIRLIALVIVVLVLVVTPIVFYVTTYNSTKSGAYDKLASSDDTTITLKSNDKLPFEFGIYCSDYRATSKTQVTMKAAAWKVNTERKINQVEVTACLGSDWLSYTSSKGSRIITSFDSSSSTATWRSFTISLGDDYPTYPSNPYWFVFVNSPELHVLINVKYAAGDSEYFYLTYSYTDYFTNATKTYSNISGPIGGISK